jgi:hypothetical protein
MVTLSRERVGTSQPKLGYGIKKGKGAAAPDGAIDALASDENTASCLLYSELVQPERARAALQQASRPCGLAACKAARLVAPDSAEPPRGQKNL